MCVCIYMYVRIHLYIHVHVNSHTHIFLIPWEYTITGLLHVSEAPGLCVLQWVAVCSIYKSYKNIHILQYSVRIYI